MVRKHIPYQHVHLGSGLCPHISLQNSVENCFSLYSVNHLLHCIFFPFSIKSGRTHDKSEKKTEGDIWVELALILVHRQEAGTNHTHWAHHTCKCGNSVSRLGSEMLFRTLGSLGRIVTPQHSVHLPCTPTAFCSHALQDENKSELLLVAPLQWFFLSSVQTFSLQQSLFVIFHTILTWWVFNQILSVMLSYIPIMTLSAECSIMPYSLQPHGL